MRVLYLIIFVFSFLQVNAQFIQRGKTLEYHGRQNKTTYTSPVSISFQGCSSTNNDKTGNLSLFFPDAKVGNVVSCTELKISNPNYVVFNRNDFDIWTLGDRNLSIILCEKSKIDRYVSTYTKVQMDISNAKYEAKKKELQKSEQDKLILKQEIESLRIEQSEEIKEIKANALIFAYIDEERLDSLQYEQHLCILNNDIERAVRIGKQIDLKNNMSKRLSNFEKSVKKTQEIGLKLFNEAEALYLHIANCELISETPDSLKSDYDILINSYRTLIEQYPNNFKCTEKLYEKIKTKLGNLLYKYADLFLEKWKQNVDSTFIIYKYMKEAASYKNSKAILWMIEKNDNYSERKFYAKVLFEGIKKGTLSIPEEYYSYYDIKDICESFPDFSIEDKSKILYYSIIDTNKVSLVHFHCKDSRLNSLKIPQTVSYNGKKYTTTQIGAAAFGDTSYVDGLKVGILGGNCETTNNYFDTFRGKVAKSFHIILPNTIDYIGAGAFDPRLSDVTIKVDIPSSIKRIRVKSFGGCKFNNMRIKIPNGVECIESAAFPENDDSLPYEIEIPYSLKELNWLEGYNGSNHTNGYGKILSTNNNRNFKIINNCLYKADGSYVYMGTIGLYNKKFFITSTLHLEGEWERQLSFANIDSIICDKDNPYYTVYDNCLYNKNQDTLLYVVGYNRKVMLAKNISDIIYERFFYDECCYVIPDDIKINSLKTLLLYKSGEPYNLYIYNKQYKGDSLNIYSLIDDVLKCNSKNTSKILCLKGLLYLAEKKFYQAYSLMDSIQTIISNDNGEYLQLLQDSCHIYMYRMGKLQERMAIGASNHEEMVDICLKLREHLNNAADYLKTEIDTYRALCINWRLGIHESYRNNYWSLIYLEKAIPYALRLIDKFDPGKYREEISNFYTSLANIALQGNAKKSFLYAHKALELNSNNIEAYEALGAYYYKESENRDEKIKELIMKVNRIDPNYSKSQKSFLCKLLNNEQPDE